MSGRLRSPDITFVRNEKVPKGKAVPNFAEFVPDLSIEGLFPSDRRKFVSRKIEEILENGIPIVWLVNPEAKTVIEYRLPSEPKTVFE